MSKDKLFGKIECFGMTLFRGYVAGKVKKVTKSFTAGPA